jgi:TatA/E family protein of Tat protein translocase
MNIGVTEVLIIFLILLLIFGGRRIPELGRALGSGFRNLKEHVGSRRSGPGGEIEADEGASRPSSADPAEDEEAARRP